MASFLILLDGSERARAERFRFERDRTRFIVRRGVLRTLLASRLGRDPAAIRFTQNAFGKPALLGSELRFNVSHSNGMALYCLAWGTELGCDIEQCDARVDIGGTARLLFASGEISELERLPPEQQQDAFFRCWTRKEAIVKALGLGLSHRLDSFDVLAPSSTIDNWSIESFEPRPGFHAAVVMRSERMKLALRPWLESGEQANGKPM